MDTGKSTTPTATGHVEPCYYGAHPPDECPALYVVIDPEGDLIPEEVPA